MNTFTEQMNCESFRKNIDLYKKLGYRWKVSAQGYQAWHLDDYLGGAGSLKASKHWRHCQADVKMHTSHVYSMIEKHRSIQKMKTVCN